MATAHTLALSGYEIDVLNTIGHKFTWSSMMRTIGIHSGTNVIPEKKAWDLVNAIYADTDNGSHDLPNIVPSPLASKLWDFCYHIV